MKLEDVGILTTAASAANGSLWQQNFTPDTKSCITQSKL